MFASLAPAAPPYVNSACGLGWHAGPWIAFPIVFSILFVLLIVFVVTAPLRWRWRARAFGGPGGPGGFGPRGFGHWGGPGAGRSAAEVVLADRFARGDIDEQEYRARLEVLRASHDEQ